MNAKSFLIGAGVALGLAATASASAPTEADLWNQASASEQAAFVAQTISDIREGMAKAADSPNPLTRAISAGYAQCFKTRDTTSPALIDDIRQSMTRYYGEPRRACHTRKGLVYGRLQWVCVEDVKESTKSFNFLPISPMPADCN